MSLILQLIDFILHIDAHLAELIVQYGSRVYAIVFWIIFVETGLVIFPFLPGDSLLFAAAALAAQHQDILNVHILFLWSALAAIIGDSVNYEIGHYLGPKATQGHYKLIKKKYIDKTNEFFDRYGWRTIVLARFVPIVRTFAPFVAWVGKMKYKDFIIYNAFGGILWTSIFIYAGYFFWNIPFIKNNFSLIILAIIMISILPWIRVALTHVIQKYRPKQSSQK